MRSRADLQALEPSTPTSTCSTRTTRTCAAGPGQPFDWELARRAPRARRRLILSRRPDGRERGRARRRDRPFAVDVASGVEAEPGRKDPATLEAFFAAVAARERPSPWPSRSGERGRAPLRPLRGPVRARDADARAGRARAGVGGHARGSRLPGELDRLLRDYAGRPTPLYRAERLSEAAGRPVWLKREDLLHTGAHKLNNALGQCAARPAHGQDADHRRDRGRPARGRHGDGVRPARAGMRRLHGHRGHAPPAAQRAAHGAARRHGRPGRGRAPRTLKEAMSEAIRDWITNVGDDPLRDRLVGRTRAVPGAGARPAAHDRRRGARAAAGARGARCPRA